MVKSFSGKAPEIANSAFVAENASIIGDVKIGENSSIWYGAVLRGDITSITIGKNSNIQDNATVHVGIKSPAIIGDSVTVGHNALVHGAKIGNNVLVGMGSVVLDNAEIGDNSIIGAGAVVTSNTIVPPDSLVLGVPAKVVKKLSHTQIAGNSMNALGYVALGKKFKSEQN